MYDINLIGIGLAFLGSSILARDGLKDKMKKIDTSLGFILLLLSFSFQFWSASEGKPTITVMVSAFISIFIGVGISVLGDSFKKEKVEREGIKASWERMVYILIIVAFILSYCPLIRFALDSMTAYQIWDLAVKALGAIGAIVAGVAVYWKFHKEKNRQMYENRLKEVYAPLVKLLVKQETFRKLYIPQISIEQAPIIYSIRKHNNTALKDGQLITTTTEEQGALDRKEFIEALNKSNYGLARPNLLSLIAQYELLIEYDNENRKAIKPLVPAQYGTSNVDEKEKEYFENSVMYKNFKKTARACVSIELKLVQEIVGGYNESINNLGTDKGQLIDLQHII